MEKIEYDDMYVFWKEGSKLSFDPHVCSEAQENKHRLKNHLWSRLLERQAALPL